MDCEGRVNEMVAEAEPSEAGSTIRSLTAAGTPDAPTLYRRVLYRQSALPSPKKYILYCPSAWTLNSTVICSASSIEAWGMLSNVCRTV